MQVWIGLLWESCNKKNIGQIKELFHLVKKTLFCTVYYPDTSLESIESCNLPTDELANKMSYI